MLDKKNPHREAWESLTRRVTKMCAEEADLAPIDRIVSEWLMRVKFPAPFGGLDAPPICFQVGKGGENTVFFYITDSHGNLLSKRVVGFPVEIVATLKSVDEKTPLWCWYKKGEIRISHSLKTAQKNARKEIWGFHQRTWVSMWRKSEDLTGDTVWISTKADRKNAAKKTARKVSIPKRRK